MVKPILEKLAKEYEGRVDLWQINADDNQDLLRELKVYGIPTLIIFRDGKETLRQVGGKPASALQSMFETLAAGGVPTPAGISTVDRVVRLTAGLALASFGWVNGTNWILLILGGALMFSGVYDRCPIWRALTSQFKKLTGHA
jgi:thioredoxin 1